MFSVVLSLKMCVSGGVWVCVFVCVCLGANTWASVYAFPYAPVCFSAYTPCLCTCSVLRLCTGGGLSRKQNSATLLVVKVCWVCEGFQGCFQPSHPPARPPARPLARPPSLPCDFFILHESLFREAPLVAEQQQHMAHTLEHRQVWLNAHVAPLREKLWQVLYIPYTSQHGFVLISGVPDNVRQRPVQLHRQALQYLSTLELECSLTGITAEFRTYLKIPSIILIIVPFSAFPQSYEGEASEISRVGRKQRHCSK